MPSDARQGCFSFPTKLLKGLWKRIAPPHQVGLEGEGRNKPHDRRRGPEWHMGHGRGRQKCREHQAYQGQHNHGQVPCKPAPFMVRKRPFQGPSLLAVDAHAAQKRGEVVHGGGL